MEKAGERTEFCIGCRRLLRFPPHAKTIHCTSCGATTDVRSRDSVRQAKNWVKGIINQFGKVSPSSTARSVPTSSSTYTQQLVFPSLQGKKRALLIGVTYSRSEYELKGTVNDVSKMKRFLMDRGFPDEFIFVLTEEYPGRNPTKQNMLAAMQWLVRGCKNGDSLVFQFSGHGSQKLDTMGNENDGFNETLCPSDYVTNGMITDDEINQILVRPLTPGVKLHAIIDSCHSGTVLDLPYLCRMDRIGNWEWENHGTTSGEGTNGGLAISFSGCDDHQKSADTNALSGNDMTGAMTYAFFQAAEKETGATYGSLLLAMRTAIRDANSPGPISSLIKKVFRRGGLTQEPQLCSSQIFDVHRTPFIL